MCHVWHRWNNTKEISMLKYGSRNAWNEIQLLKLQYNKCDAILVSTLLSDSFAIFTQIDQGLVAIIW